MLPSRLGKYVPERLLGSGGMGDVYYAIDIELGRPVALKVLPPDLTADPVRSTRLLFQTTVDSEIILHLLAQPTCRGQANNLVQSLRCLEGAYSLVIMTVNELIGVRDPHGFRPLCLGRIDDAWVLASETCALDLINAEFVRDVEPGEIVTINRDGLNSTQGFPQHERRAFCIFEYVYFARPDSTIAGRNVYKVRVEMGRQLAREFPIKADVVVPVPDSGNCALRGSTFTRSRAPKGRLAISGW